MNKKMAVLGTGAIGSSVGADLTKAGYDVLLIDQWSAHVEAMKAHGLHVRMREEEVQVPVQAAHLGELATGQWQFDIVFLTAKSYDSCWLAHFIKPYLKPDGVLVSLQNSLNDEWIAPIIGYERDIGAVVELSAEVFEPAEVKRNTDRSHTWFAVGELHGRVTPRVQEIAQILGAVGVAEVTTNIWGAKWSKLVVNTMLMAVDGILGVRPSDLIDHPGLFRLCIKLGRETMQVGSALGYRMEPLFGVTAEDLLGSSDEVLEKNLRAIITTVGRQARSTVLQDHLKGRRSEVVDYLNGLVAKKGREAGVPTPVNEAIADLTRQIEEGVLKPDRSNIELLREFML